MIDGLLERGEIGGRTVQVVEGGAVECAVYPVPEPRDGQLLIRTARSAISPGTELTFVGRQASNVYLHKEWDPARRLFRPGAASLSYPLTFGYRASGVVVESRVAAVPVGTRIFGNWRHTEYILGNESMAAQVLPDQLTHDDGVDLGQMAPIALNAVLAADVRHAGAPVVVFGAGPVGILTAQVARATGASSVHVVDRLAGRLSVAATLGLPTVHASAGRDVALLVKDELGADAIPVAFECTGSTGALHEAIRTVRRRGVVVAVGFYQGGATDLFLGEEFHHNGVHIVSGQIGNIHPDWDMAGLRRRSAELVISGGLVLGRLPRLVLPVDRAAEGFAALGRPDEVFQVTLAYD